MLLCRSAAGGGAGSTDSGGGGCSSGVGDVVGVGDGSLGAPPHAISTSPAIAALRMRRGKHKRETAAPDMPARPLLTTARSGALRLVQAEHRALRVLHDRE